MISEAKTLKYTRDQSHHIYDNKKRNIKGLMYRYEQLLFGTNYSLM